MELAVLNKEGKETGNKVTLSEDIFGIEPNEHAVYLDVKLNLANRRQGTHKAKERGEITGSMKKLKRQKGTGTARSGSIKNPLLRGGGRIFGPRPRDYSFKLNRKVKKLAKKSVLSSKASENSVIIVDSLDFQKPYTKNYISFISAINTSDVKTLLVLPEGNVNVSLSARNLKKCNVLTVNQLSTYDLINADKIILLEGAIPKIEEILK